MANKIFQDIGMNQNNFMKQLNKLKSKGGDPNEMIQSLLSSGRVSQNQVNQAAQIAQTIMQILPPGAQR